MEAAPDVEAASEMGHSHTGLGLATVTDLLSVFSDATNRAGRQRARSGGD